MSSCPETCPVMTGADTGGFTSHARTESSPAGLGITPESHLPDFRSEDRCSPDPSEPELNSTETEELSQAALSTANHPALAPYYADPLQPFSNIQLTDVFTVAQTESTGPESIPDSFYQTYVPSDQPVDTESASTFSVFTIPESQVDTKPHDFSPTKSDSVSVYGSTHSSPSPSTRSGLLRQKPPGFFWQLDSHGFPCSATDCNKRCNLWDGRSVICPKCGPFSEIRYCSKKHLLENVEAHWAFCGLLTFTHPCHESSIPADIRAGPPLVPCLLQYDTLERHRQALYFNTCEDLGDYFIFADLFETDLDKCCSSKVIMPVVFDDLAGKDRFRRILAACLFYTVEVVDLVDYISGTRHACSTEWDGCSRRACHDAVCRGEYRRILGQLGGMGHRRLVEYLESGCWVLRAVRTTHPAVESVEERMMGVGFEGVIEEDQRKFSWGAGWDAAGGSEMEMEPV